MKSLDYLVEAVARIADEHGFTPCGLLDYLRDMDANPELYGSDLARERIEMALIGDTGIEVEEITSTVCLLATSVHREAVIEYARACQKEADALGMPVSSVIGTASPAEILAVVEGRKTKKKRTVQDAGTGPVLGYEVFPVLQWMGAAGWDLGDAVEVLAHFGQALPNHVVLDELEYGREAGLANIIPKSVQSRLTGLLEE